MPAPRTLATRRWSRVLALAATLVAVLGCWSGPAAGGAAAGVPQVLMAEVHDCEDVCLVEHEERDPVLAVAPPEDAVAVDPLARQPRTDAAAPTRPLPAPSAAAPPWTVRSSLDLGVSRV